jgi:Bacterial Ig-like domain (group 3)/FG-GAP repeat
LFLDIPGETDHVTPAAPVLGQTVTLIITISPATAPGFVAFMDGGTLVGTGKVSASGIAQATTLALSAGQHSLVAVYGGNTGGGYLASHSVALPYILTAAAGSGFAMAVNCPTGSNARSVVVGDFNGDGKADLVVANKAATNVTRRI